MAKEWLMDFRMGYLTFSFKLFLLLKQTCLQSPQTIKFLFLRSQMSFKRMNCTCLYKLRKLDSVPHLGRRSLDTRAIISGKVQRPGEASNL